MIFAGDGRTDGTGPRIWNKRRSIAPPGFINLENDELTLAGIVPVCISKIIDSLDTPPLPSRGLMVNILLLLLLLFSPAKLYYYTRDRDNLGKIREESNRFFILLEILFKNAVDIDKYRGLFGKRVANL